MELAIVTITKMTAPQVSSMIKASYEAYVAQDFDNNDQKKFLQFITPEALLLRQQHGGLILIAIYNESIAGAIEVDNGNHLELFYVDKEFLHQGIGKELFFEAVRRVKNAHSSTLEVESSIFSKNIYENLGFKSISPTVDTASKTIHMQYTIPND